MEGTDLWEAGIGHALPSQFLKRKKKKKKEAISFTNKKIWLLTRSYS
jgi:hypothetical protein